MQHPPMGSIGSNNDDDRGVGSNNDDDRALAPIMMTISSIGRVGSKYAIMMRTQASL